MRIIALICLITLFFSGCQQKDHYRFALSGSFIQIFNESTGELFILYPEEKHWIKLSPGGNIHKFKVDIIDDTPHENTDKTNLDVDINEIEKLINEQQNS